MATSRTPASDPDDPSLQVDVVPAELSQLAEPQRAPRGEHAKGSRVVRPLSRGQTRVDLRSPLTTLPAPGLTIGFCSRIARGAATRMGPAYGADETLIAVRLAVALSKRDDAAVMVFLMGDAVTCAIAGQKTPDGYYILDRISRASSGTAERSAAAAPVSGPCLPHCRRMALGNRRWAVVYSDSDTPRASAAIVKIGSGSVRAGPRFHVAEKVDSPSDARQRATASSRMLANDGA